MNLVLTLLETVASAFLSENRGLTSLKLGDRDPVHVS